MCSSTMKKFLLPLFFSSSLGSTRHFSGSLPHKMRFVQFKPLHGNGHSKFYTFYNYYLQFFSFLRVLGTPLKRLLHHEQVVQPSSWISWCIIPWLDQMIQSPIVILLFTMQGWSQPRKFKTAQLGDNYYVFV